jgi:hypothetical protein
VEDVIMDSQGLRWLGWMMDEEVRFVDGGRLMEMARAVVDD